MAVFGDVTGGECLTCKVGQARINGDNDLVENVIALFPSDIDGNPTGPARMILREPMLEIILKCYLADRNPELKPISEDQVKGDKKPALKLASIDGKTIH